MNPDIEYEFDKLQTKIDYYAGLIDYLDDCIPCLGELIQMYDEGLEEDE